MSENAVIDAPEPPEGVRFADAESEENFRKAMSGEPNEYGIRPMVVITGEPGTGKTRLATHILTERYGSAQPTLVPKVPAAMEKELIAANSKGYVFFDNGWNALKSTVLPMWLCSKRWIYRKMGTHEIAQFEVDMQVVVTGCGLELTDDMQRRAIRIELV